jgi:putative solute:sodium symporter small subunit
MPRPDESNRSWVRTRRWTGLLLIAWFISTLGIAFFARELDARIFGWPFSFWIAAQGAPLFCLLLVGVYARVMNRLDAPDLGGRGRRADGGRES